MGGWTGSVIARTHKCFVTRLPVEAADTLVVDAVFLVVSSVVAGETEWLFRCDVAKGEMVKFLEEGESLEMMDGVYEVGLLLIYDGVGSSDVFEAAVCLVCSV